MNLTRVQMSCEDTMSVSAGIPSFFPNALIKIIISKTFSLVTSVANLSMFSAHHLERNVEPLKLLESSTWNEIFI
jgi:hypothetical protein